jgi:glycosyltransferase involved in cell wall biosynthesis
MERLAEIRSCQKLTWELRFGFVIQNSNLEDAIPFLDLCEEFNALPQYTLVSGDWHQEKPTTYNEKRKAICVLEMLDKELWARGFNNKMIASALNLLNIRDAATKGWPGHLVKDIYLDDTVEGKLQLARALGARKGATIFVHLGNTKMPDPFIDTLLPANSDPVDSIFLVSNSEMEERDNLVSCLLSVPESNDASAYLARFAKNIEEIEQHKELHLTIEVNTKLQEEWVHIQKLLNGLEFKSLRIKLPYYLNNRPTSAIYWDSFIQQILLFGEAKGWQFLGGDTDLLTMGLSLENQFPQETILADTRNLSSFALSLVTPVYNRSKELPEFLASIESQSVEEAFEIILIDDGSSDDSPAILLDFAHRHRGRFHVVVVLRHRKTPYRSKTFTFTAGGARQSGVNISQGRLLLFLDPDQLIDKDCLQQHLYWWRAGFEVILGDRRDKNRLLLDGQWFYWASLRQKALNQNRNWWDSFYTGNVSIDRKVFMDVGGFDETLQYWGLDDTDLAYRLARKGVCMWHTPRALVYHLNHDSGGGNTRMERYRAFRLHMEVLYRKYLDKRVLEAYSFIFNP